MTAPIVLRDPSDVLADRDAHRMQAQLDRLRDPDDRRADPVTAEEIIDALESEDRERRTAGAYVAGRYHADSTAIDDALRRVVDAHEPTDLRSSALLYVEAAMSLAMRGDVDAGSSALRAVVASDQWTIVDWLAAFYLARLGDPSAYPQMVACLEDEDGYTRLMAARHLIGFVPFQGQRIDGQVVDVWSRVLERVEDSDPMITVEVPSLLAELGGAAAVPILESIRREHPADDTRRAAERALALVGS